MTKSEEKLSNQIKELLKAYFILEEYTCELASDDLENNEIISYTNDIVQKNSSILINQ
jgi:hypothetical protein